MIKCLVRGILKLKPRRNAEAAVSKGEDYINTEKVNINWGHQDDYELLDHLGRGKYSEVYKGVNLLTLEPVVIKILKPVKVSRICREIKILQQVAGRNNTALLKEVVKDYATQVPSLILEFIENDEPKNRGNVFNDFEIRYYIHEVAKALEYCHSLGIIHRDVKSSNIMIDHKTRKCRLIDWGLADFYNPNSTLSVRVASKPYKSPELLLGYEHYDYSLDSWCLGVTMAGMIFQKDPFFNGEDNDKVLLNIINVLGAEELYEYCSKFGINIESRIEKSIEKQPKKPWSRYITQENKRLVSAEAMDLINGMLMYDHNLRLLPSEIIQHRYFDPVREMWQILNSGSEIPKGKAYTETAEILRKQKPHT